MVDKRTKAYLGVIKKDVGYLGFNSGEELSFREILDKRGFKATPLETIWEQENSSLIRYEIDGMARFCYEVWAVYGCDGLNVTTYIFLSKPSDKDIETIRLVVEIEFAFQFRNFKGIYCCWECGGI